MTQGDRVFVLTDRIPELYVAVLGALKHRAVVCPLFSAFGPEPIRARLTIGGGRVLVTTAALYKKKVQSIRDGLTDLEHVLLIGEETDIAGVAGARPHTGCARDLGDRHRSDG